MKVLHLDFETHYKSGKDGHSLRTLTYRDYCLSPKFQTIGVSLAWGAGPVTWVPGPQVAEVLASIDWSTTAAHAFNSLFDMSVLHYIYGIHPAEVICSKSLATTVGLRLLNGGSLDNVSDALRDAGYPIEHKGTEVIMADGKYYNDFTPGEMARYAEYCCKDTRIARDVLNALLPYVSIEELRYQSMMLKAGTEPVLLLDRPMLEQEIVRVEELQSSVLQTAAVAHGCTELQFRALIMSNQKFAALLEEYGCEVPMKVSKVTKRPAPALAKTDAGLNDLLEHESVYIQVFAAARLGAKSVDAIAKAARMRDMADQGPVTFCYNISGAHTHRLSATQKLNVMALPSGRTAGSSNACRRAIYAPEGYVVGAVDSAQVELRTAYAITDDRELKWVFKQGKDPYSTLAAAMYRRDYDDIRGGAKAGNPVFVKMRAGGKSGLLGGLYGAGAKGFHTYSHSVAKSKISMSEAKETVDTFRSTFPSIPEFWRTCEGVLQAMIRGRSGYFGGESGTMFFYDGSRELFGVKCPGIRLPDGNWLNYLDLRTEKAPEADEGMFQRETDTVYHQVLGKNRVKTNIYGSKMFENLNQALAFAVIKLQMLRINEKFRVVMQVHDECSFLVPTGREDEAKAWAIECFAWTPDWLGGCVLAGEVGIAQRYGDC